MACEGRRGAIGFGTDVALEITVACALAESRVSSAWRCCHDRHLLLADVAYVIQKLITTSCSLIPQAFIDSMIQLISGNNSIWPKKASSISESPGD